MKKSYLIFVLCLQICLLGFVVSDNSTVDDSIIEDVSEVSETNNNLDTDSGDQSVAWGEWSPWSKWSGCSRSCGGGISRQQRRCRRKPCKGRPWSTKYKICNPEPCENSNDFRAEQCASFDDVPYSGQLLKWYPHYDPAKPCALICRGEQSLENTGNRLRQETSVEKTLPHDATEALQLDSEETIVVQLAEKVEDGTKCYTDGTDVCIGGECMKVGCDLRVGSNKNTDACGVCGGNGSSCQSRYSWSLESISACSKSCGGGIKIAVAVCKSIGPDESVVDDSYCDPDNRPEKTLIPCNTHPCTAKWVAGEWSICSASCGGGSRTRTIFCTEKNGNETTKLPDHKCSSAHKPRNQETCNTISCPMWETDKWSECSVTCGTGVRTRTIECRDAVGSISKDCDPAERPHTEQQCKTNIPCPIYGEEMTQPLMQPYPPPPVSEKLIDQPIPSESTFIAEKWSPCSVTCGEGIRYREVRCKIFLEFSRTVVDLPDRQCSGPKPIEQEKCVMGSCNVIENSLIYGIDTVGDSGYAEPSLTDTYKSSAAGSSGSGYDALIKVAPGSDVQTTYSWKEAGYTPCSATCLGGHQELIVNCVRDDTGKTVMPFLCTAETKPEARIRLCNDYPCPPRWNFSDFSECLSPCGLGIQTRYVICIHEVTRGTGKTVPVPHHLCPQPPPAGRQYCNVVDCPVKWNTGKWGKCSKTCGGGVKKREVTCEQIMAQGRRQFREESQCPPQKPATEKPCNTRPCHDMDAGSMPIITSQNTTYNQTDLNVKVDLKIGGIAKVFQGTSSIKIRCPVRKFDKAQIVWTKDNKELRKSKKYKISMKGALKINDITTSDNGVYACKAGNSHAETRLIVKFRSGELSSEEYLRLSNSVHRQRNANLDSAPANSGESLYTDRAAAYGNRFVPIDSEDLSHERTAANNKPTRKPHQKKQKTSPTPPDTMIHKEHTVTSLNQPGYHESVESTAPASSSASTLVPHLSYFISTLKEYWPFQTENFAKRSHRTTQMGFIDNLRKDTVATKRTMPERTSGLRYENVEDNLDTLYRNTAIPDETFGPDEERIFIDVDPYDLDESLFGLQQSDPVKITPVIGKDNSRVTTTKFDMDYVEESLKNVKRQWQENSEAKHQWSSTSKNQNKEPVNLPTTSQNIGLDAYYIPDSSTKHSTEKLEESHHKRTSVQKNHNSESEHVSPTSSLKETDVISRKLDSDNKKLEVLNRTEDYEDIFEDEIKKRRVYVENDTIVDDSMTPKAIEDDLIDLAMTEDRESDEVEKDIKSLSRNPEDRNNSSEGTTDSLQRSVNEETQKSIKLLNTTTTASVATNVTTIDPTIAALDILDTAENLVIEWVTTEWSKCSQTCGGSGFQMRGAQCTVRPAKPTGNSTRTPPRTVIGAKLCEDAGHPVPQKVKPCGFGKCPQWHTTEWTLCETSRCFNWKTAMQRRDVACRLVEDMENGQQNVTLLDPNKCDDTIRPLQRQECYNDACKGVWRVGEWTECTASCEKDGIKYRILQCVWYGTKKPAGNACRDIPRPPVMKTCKGPPCHQTTDDCKDHSQLCSRVKTMNMCKVPLYQKQCCQSCH